MAWLDLMNTRAPEPNPWTPAFRPLPPIISETISDLINHSTITPDAPWIWADKLETSGTCMLVAI